MIYYLLLQLIVCFLLLYYFLNQCIDGCYYLFLLSINYCISFLVFYYCFADSVDFLLYLLNVAQSGLICAISIPQFQISLGCSLFIYLRSRHLILFELVELAFLLRYLLFQQELLSISSQVSSLLLLELVQSLLYVLSDRLGH